MIILNKLLTWNIEYSIKRPLLLISHAIVTFLFKFNVKLILSKFKIKLLSREKIKHVDLNQKAKI